MGCKKEIPRDPNADAQGHTPATPVTAAANEQVLGELPFSDEQGFADSRRGLMVSDPELRVKNAKGKTIWNQPAYGFIRGKAPAICRSVLKSDPFSGYVFVFRNRRGTAIKILVYDGQGYWLCQKRLPSGRFHWWPEKGRVKQLAAHELQMILWNTNPEGAAPLWKKINLG